MDVYESKLCDKNNARVSTLVGYRVGNRAKDTNSRGA